MDVVDLFARGGPVMFVIAVASIVGLGVFIERMWALQRSRVIPSQLSERVFQFVHAGKIDDAALLCADGTSAASSIYRAILKKAGAPLVFVKEAAEEAGRQEAARLEQYVGALGTVASITPLLGLLGTVTGMIAVFQRVAETGVGDPLQMAAGIWEALITTAFGLGVGIPALMAHRYILARVDRIVLELEDDAARLADLVIDETPRPAATEAHD